MYFYLTNWEEERVYYYYTVIIKIIVNDDRQVRVINDDELWCMVINHGNRK